MIDAPLYSFVGTTKQVNFAALSQDQQLIVEFAVPGFFQTSSLGDREWDWLKIRERDDLIKQVHGSGTNRRRYSPAAFLPRGRYYSVVNDSQGHDSGTMADELKAYRDPLLSGYVVVLDSSEPSGIWSYPIKLPNGRDALMALGGNGLLFGPSVMFLLYDDEKFERAIGKTELSRLRASYDSPLWELGSAGHDIVYCKPDSEAIGPFLVLRLPWSIQAVSVTRVLDLRRPDVQKWFCFGFCAWLRKNFPRYPIKDNAEFHEYFIFPLVCQQLGGGLLNWIVGMWAMEHGVNGIVYPSARHDIRVIWSSTEVADHQGWNFVDLRVNDEEEKAKIVSELDGIRKHSFFEMLVDDEFSSEVTHSVNLLRHAQVVVDVRGGFKVEGLRTLNEMSFAYRLHSKTSNWAPASIRARYDHDKIDRDFAKFWRSGIVDSSFNASDVDKIALKYIRGQAITDLESRDARQSAALLRAENAHLRKSRQLLCDCCDVPLDGSEAYALSGKLVAERNIVQDHIRNKCASIGVSIEIMQRLIMKKAESDPTPWITCESCALQHLDDRTGLAQSKIVAQQYFAGETVDIATLPVSVSQVFKPKKRWWHLLYSAMRKSSGRSSTNCLF